MNKSEVVSSRPGFVQTTAGYACPTRLALPRGFTVGRAVPAIKLTADC